VQVYSLKSDLAAFISQARRPIGLVPTMGALHKGHLSLIRQAMVDCETVVVTIFVNSTQFSSSQDYDNYPRAIEDDLAILKNEKVSAVYVPDDSDIYPLGFVTSINMKGFAQALEGEARPGHFDGVATIVTKLLNRSMPDQMYLGQKDAQQVAVIRRLVSDLDIPVRIVVCPTIREDDGLAFSSRNVQLGASQRQAATILYKALAATRDRYRAGNHNYHELIDGCRRIIESEKLIDKTDYIEIVDAENFTKWDEKGPCLLLAAVKLGDIRLIDNVLMD